MDFRSLSFLGLESHLHRKTPPLHSSMENIRPIIKERNWQVKQIMGFVINKNVDNYTILSTFKHKLCGYYVDSMWIKLWINV